MQLPEKTASIIIGNPQVVDVAMLKGNRKVVLTGKGFGETNFIAIDKNGEALVEAVVKVAAVEKNLIVQRGLDRESYHCNPRCQPTVALGDATRFMGEAAAQVTARTIAATGAAR
jgi:Flp pilus assembly secretin CpaC